MSEAPQTIYKLDEISPISHDHIHRTFGANQDFGKVGGAKVALNHRACYKYGLQFKKNKKIITRVVITTRQATGTHKTGRVADTEYRTCYPRQS